MLKRRRSIQAGEKSGTNRNLRKFNMEKCKVLHLERTSLQQHRLGTVSGAALWERPWRSFWELGMGLQKCWHQRGHQHLVLLEQQENQDIQKKHYHPLLSTHYITPRHSFQFGAAQCRKDINKLEGIQGQPQWWWWLDNFNVRRGWGIWPCSFWSSNGFRDLTATSSAYSRVVELTEQVWAPHSSAVQQDEKQWA